MEFFFKLSEATPQVYCEFHLSPTISVFTLLMGMAQFNFRNDRSRVADDPFITRRKLLVFAHRGLVVHVGNSMICYSIEKQVDGRT